MNDSKTYMHIVDGSDAWIPIEVKKLNENEFLVVEFPDFDPEDTSLIPRFIPGDIVTRKRKSSEDKTCWIADQLIKRSSHKDKKYLEFLYRIVTGDKLKNSIERIAFSDVIQRVMKEIDSGIFHYPAIINYVKGIQPR